MIGPMHVLVVTRAAWIASHAHVLIYLSDLCAAASYCCLH